MQNPKPRKFPAHIFYTEVKLSLCFVLNRHHAVEAYWGNAGIVPLEHGTKWT